MPERGSTTTSATASSTTTAGSDGTHPSPIADFDTWFKDSILRPTTDSVYVSGSIQFAYTGNELKPSGRSIYIPTRNGRQIFGVTILRANNELCPLGVALVGNPADGMFKNINGESMFVSNPTEALVTILVRSASGINATFENIDGINTTNPGQAIQVLADPAGGSGPATLYNLGNVKGTIENEATHFVSFGVAPVDIWIGPDDPRAYTVTAVGVANFAFLHAFQVFRPHTVTTAKTYIAAQSGNIDVGIYNAAGHGSGRPAPSLVRRRANRQSPSLRGSPSLRARSITSPSHPIMGQRRRPRARASSI